MLIVIVTTLGCFETLMMVVVNGLCGPLRLAVLSSCSDRIVVVVVVVVVVVDVNVVIVVVVVVVVVHLL